MRRRSAAGRSANRGSVVWYRLKYEHPWVADTLHFWPATVFLPVIFVLIAALAVLTHWWDERDDEAREASRRANSGLGPVGEDGS
jgi:hypothetical protein